MTAVTNAAVKNIHLHTLGALSNDIWQITD